ncbi:hypothetical protein GCM10028793_15730 [Nocardiopsis oceani]
MREALLGWVFRASAGFPVSCRPMVAVSAARLKVVAIERFAREGRCTLTRFAAPAGGRLSGNGGPVVGAPRGRTGPSGPGTAARRAKPGGPSGAQPTGRVRP